MTEIYKVVWLDYGKSWFEARLTGNATSEKYHHDAEVQRLIAEARANERKAIAVALSQSRFRDAAPVVLALSDAPPRQVTPQKAAKVLLEAYDARMRGGEVSEAQREMASSVGIAACFGAAAYDAAKFAGADVAALARAFLTALIDEAHPDLDYLRTDPKAGQVARDSRAALRALANGDDSDGT